MRIGTLLRPSLWILWGLVVFIATLWCVGALYYSNLPGQWLRTTAAGLFACGTLAAFLLLPLRRRTSLWFVLAFLGVALYWLWIPASHDRAWQTSSARLPQAVFDGDLVHVKDIRSFEYRTEKDFAARYHDRTFNLNELSSLDVMLVFWDENRAIAHMMLSFGFQEREYLTVSVETRLEKGEDWSELASLFKQYELIYILGDETDLVRLRTNIRGEQVHLYRASTDDAFLRSAFDEVLGRVNDIHESPEWFHALADNCSTSYWPILKQMHLLDHFDFRLLANGYFDEMAIEKGWFETTLPYEEARRRAHVNPLVADDPDPADFSRRIRPFLSGP